MLLRCFLVWLIGGVYLSAALGAADNSIQWQRNPERVTADLNGAPLDEVLLLIAEATGWEVYVEPKSEGSTNVKFRDRPPSDALKLILGNLSFAVLPQTNGPQRLMVFRTKLHEATQMVAVKKEDTSKPIANEIIVTLKPGANIEELAKKLGAKIVGRIDELNTYRLQFEDAESAEKARKELKENSEVAAVDSNYPTVRPPDVGGVTLSSMPEIDLKPSSSTDCSKVVVGLIDTALPKTGSSTDAFLLPSIDVAGGSAAASTSPPHASAMASTILRGYQYSSKGKTTAPVSILPVNVYGANSQASTFDVANGIYRAINAGAKIINLSLGSEGSSAFLAEMIRKGRAQDVMFIAAAGNEPTTRPTFPAADPDVLAVTASDRSGGLASYANRGEFVDVIAPGTSIFSFGGQNYVSSGTSVATAYVSGMAAALSDPCNRPYSTVDSQVREALALKR